MMVLETGCKRTITAFGDEDAARDFLLRYCVMNCGFEVGHLES
jgi:hypothetical protein